jgi:hypothetical protein
VDIGQNAAQSLHSEAMTSQERAFHDFDSFAAKLKGGEKSEPQTFLFHFLEAFALEVPGENRMREAQSILDAAVRRAYGMEDDADALAFLLNLNLQLAVRESNREAITPPGLPATKANPKDFISADCVTCSLAPN